MTQQEIGIRMKELRKAAGLTVEQLSSQTGINKSSINQMELGRQNMTICNLIKLCDAIHAEVSISAPSLGEGQG